MSEIKSSISRFALPWSSDPVELVCSMSVVVDSWPCSWQVYPAHIPVLQAHLPDDVDGVLHSLLAKHVSGLLLPRQELRMASAQGLHALISSGSTQSELCSSRLELDAVGSGHFAVQHLSSWKTDQPTCMRFFWSW